MPYIKSDLRSDIDAAVVEVVDKINLLWRAGEINEAGVKGVLNYTITTLVNRLYQDDSYSNFNDIVGVLECVKLEFYRRRVAPYENQKAFENGDVFGYALKYWNDVPSKRP